MKSVDAINSIKKFGVLFLSVRANLRGEMGRAKHTLCLDAIAIDGVRDAGCSLRGILQWESNLKKGTIVKNDCTAENT
jgi:hypothetical protein